MQIKSASTEAEYFNNDFTKEPSDLVSLISTSTGISNDVK